MVNQTATELRARASQARRIAENMQNERARLELREMADALDEEAAKLDVDELPQPISPPANGA